MRRFEGQHVLVTGASRGLGRSIAVAAAEEGAFVGIAYRARDAEAAQTLDLVRAAGGGGLLLRFDVRDAVATTREIDRFREARGRIDVCVGNAAIVDDAPFALAPPDAWHDVIEVNLVGTSRVLSAVVRPMIAEGRGAIVVVASVAGLRANPGQTSYAAAKAGLLGLTRTLAAELAPRGVRVNAVVPGFIKTGMATRLPKDVVERRTKDIPLGRFATPEEIAKTVLFLASADASYVVGHTLVVDGGLSI